MLLWVMVFIGALLLLECDSALLGKEDSKDGTNGGTNGGNPGGTTDHVAGTWLKVFPSPYFDYDGPASPAVADATILEIQVASGSASGYLRITTTKLNGTDACVGALAPYTVIDSNHIEITFPARKGTVTRQ